LKSLAVCCSLLQSVAGGYSGLSNAVGHAYMHCNTHCNTHCNSHCNTCCNTRCNTHYMQCPAVWCSLLQSVAVPSNAVGCLYTCHANHTATHCNTICNALQSIAVCCCLCSLLQHTATPMITPVQCRKEGVCMRFRTIYRHTLGVHTTQCNTKKHTHCSANCSTLFLTRCNTLQHTTAHSRCVHQCVAVCCSVL